MDSEAQEARPDWRFVSDPAEVAGALAHLSGAELVGLDTETYWKSAGAPMTVSLVQLAPPEGEVVVFDALALGVEPVRELIESAGVRMAAHNARFDAGVLRAAGLEPRALYDTLTMSRMALSLKSHSLASVCEHLFGLALDKSFQKSNWRRRPLSREQLEYAALDARLSLRLFRELSKVFEAEGKLETALLAAEVRPPRDPDAKPRRKTAPPPPEAPLTPAEKRTFERLKRWRMGWANSQRVPAYMVCPDRTLRQLARERPTGVEGLAAVFGLGEAKIKKFGEELLRALRESTE
ncbi:MAG TPA: HRDC domain-containing protein [Pyrinomonadaceae bacterium]|nr:HRDC domain-containing protein [Pyrinomonadaceae bacterium]